jgi:hypothetical protein
MQEAAGHFPVTHARTVRFPVAPADREQSVADLKDATQPLKEHAGFQHAYWLYDEGHGVMLSVALYDSAEAEAAAWRVMKPRLEARMQELGVAYEVHTHEVVHEL